MWAFRGQMGLRIMHRGLFQQAQYDVGRRERPLFGLNEPFSHLAPIREVALVRRYIAVKWYSDVGSRPSGL